MSNRNMNNEEASINISEPIHMPIIYFSDTIRAKIKLQPDFQREFVWPVSKQKGLIKSLFRGIPIQMLYFAKKLSGELEVIDGQQRLTTIFGFLDPAKVPKDVRGKLAKKIDIMDEEGNKIKKDKLKDIIKQRRISYVEIEDKDLSLSKKYEIFQTLNKGAMPLKAQEIRNCMFEGEKMPYLNKALRKGAKALEKFLRVDFRRMEGEEYVLRFFMINLEQKYGDKRVANLLDKFDFIKKELTKEKVKQLSNRFKNFLKRLENIFSINGKPFESYFQVLKGDVRQPKKQSNLRKYTYTGKINQGLFHLFSYYLPQFDSNQFNKIKRNKFQRGYIELLTNKKFVENVAGSGTDSPRKMTRSKNIFDKEFKKIYLGEPTEKLPRNITRQERKTLFNNIPYCYLCYKEFKKFEEAVGEHIEPFDKGHDSKFENILLSCETCNAEKGKKSLEEYRERSSSVKRRFKNRTNILKYLKCLKEWHKSFSLHQYNILIKLAQSDWKH